MLLDACELGTFIPRRPFLNISTNQALIYFFYLEQSGHSAKKAIGSYERSDISQQQFVIREGTRAD